jgi:hypothetical protein
MYAKLLVHTNVLGAYHVQTIEFGTLQISLRIYACSRAHSVVDQVQATTDQV